MPKTVTFSYNIVAAGVGGKLVSTGQPITNKLKDGDALQVQVRWAAAPSGRNLQSYMVITPLKDSNQVLASPFRDAAGRFACLMTTSGVSADSNGFYTFPVATYSDPNGTLGGQFELTVVIGDSTTDTMWSADPEFDTGG